MQAPSLREGRPEALYEAEAGVRLVDPIYAWAARSPDAPAIADAAIALSYEGLVLTIERLVAMLRSLGIASGDRLMVVGENSVALACLILAGNRLGAGVALENARRATPEVAAILEHCRPKRAIFVLAGSPESGRHAAHFGAAAMIDPALGSFAVLDPSETLDEGEAESFAVMIYTTGTTGAPKGVMLTDANLTFIALMMERLRRIGPHDRVYGVLPITHVMGLASVLLGSLHNGAQVHLRARFAPRHCLEELHALRITAIQGATAMFTKLVEQARADGWSAPSSLRFTAAGGAPIDMTVKRKAEELFGTTLHNGYGLTEAASLCWTRFEDGNADESVGPALPGVELRVCDDNGAELPTGEVGELWVRGPNVTRGYFRNPDLTAKTITADGWFGTQDLARVSADGRVFVVGRAKDVIFRSGFKVNPLEVETVLNRHPAISHSAVVGRAVEGNEEVIAFLELVPPASDVPPDLRDLLREFLSPYKHPTEIVVVSSLPLAPNGKVLKHDLQRIARSRPIVSSPP